MATPSSEEVRYDIRIEAKEAIKNLREILKHTEDNADKIKVFSALVLDSAERWGTSWQKALNVYKQLNAELAKSKKGTLFGQTGGQDLFGQTGKLLESTEQVRRSQDRVSSSADNMGSKLENAGKRGAAGMHLVRIALGALEAMILFRLVNAIETFFRGAIDQARQFEDTLYRLRNVEETLSMEGIEISMKGMKQGITDIQKLLPIFSKEDVSQLVGTLAISTKQLKLNERQILDLAKAIGILNIRSEKQEDLSTTAQHVLSSLLTGNAKGITALGIAFTDNTMKAKAMELGFLDAGEALTALTENEKGLTKLQLLLDSTAKETENINEYLDSNSAKIQENAAAWKDLQTSVGQALLPFIPVLTGIFKFITDGFNAGKVAIIELTVALAVFQKMWNAVTTMQPLDVEQLKRDVAELRTELVNEFFKEMPEDAPEWFKQGWGDLIKAEAETATAAMQDLEETTSDIDTSGLEKIEDVLKDLSYAVKDLATEFARKLEDLNLEYLRKAEDAERDYLRKVEDINRDYQNRKAELLSKHRREDEKAEREYQNKLWELRMRFLMDLEDALHARDARQVLRLIKQYNLDKEALKRKHALESEDREASQREEMEALERQKQERLEQARLEYEQKLADLNLAKQREQEDLAKWYMREFEDLVAAKDRKLQELIQGWAEEQKITAENAAAVYEILKGYFGPGGLTDQLYQYMMQSLINATQNALQAFPFPNAPNLPPPPANPPPDTPREPVREDMPFAEGGTLLATRPTRTLFGEKGPELVNFTPLNRIGKNVHKIFGDLSGRGVNGKIMVDLDLSPDLQGRIVKQSMEGVAEVVGKINRSKV